MKSLIGWFGWTKEDWKELGKEIGGSILIASMLMVTIFGLLITL